MFRPPPKKPPTIVGRVLKTLSKALDETIFPTSCPICGVFRTGSPICEDCRAELRDASGRPCPRCAMPVGPYSDVSGGCSDCRGTPLGFDAAVALGPYQGPIRELCLRMKSEKNAWLAHWLAEVWVESRAEALAKAVGDDDPAPPLVTSIPQHWAKSMRRSFYNQAETLAEELAQALGLRHKKALKRIKPTPKLAELSRTRRLAELKGAFSASPRLVQGRQILLVDDILTSGATCGAAARALKQAGAKRVVALVIGRAEGLV